MRAYGFPYLFVWRPLLIYRGIASAEVLCTSRTAFLIGKADPRLEGVPARLMHGTSVTSSPLGPIMGCLFVLLALSIAHFSGSCLHTMKCAIVWETEYVLKFKLF